jgi:hypothetical protein
MDGLDNKTHRYSAMKDHEEQLGIGLMNVKIQPIQVKEAVVQ